MLVSSVTRVGAPAYGYGYGYAPLNYGYPPVSALDYGYGYAAPGYLAAGRPLYAPAAAAPVVIGGTPAPIVSSVTRAIPTTSYLPVTTSAPRPLYAPAVIGGTPIVTSVTRTIAPAIYPQAVAPAVIPGPTVVSSVTRATVAPPLYPGAIYGGGVIPGGYPVYGGYGGYGGRVVYGGGLGGYYGGLGRGYYGGVGGYYGGLGGGYYGGLGGYPGLYDGYYGALRTASPAIVTAAPPATSTA